MKKLREKLKRVPSSPGSYLMKDKEGDIIYVGKAKNLKHRLSSYFARTSIEEPKTHALVQEITDFDIILVNNEVEALLLERSLIKEHKPRFNVILRDDKEYPYLRVDLQNQWPRIKKVRRRKNDGATYLGPFSHVSQLNAILDLTFRIFPLIRCSEHYFANTTRPCNYYHMKRCLGPCTLPVKEDLYKGMVRDAIAFLQGKNKGVMKALKEKLLAASESEEYELAGRYRDQLHALRTITQEQNVVIKSIKDCDAFGIAHDQDTLSLHVLKIREGKITGKDRFIVPMPLPHLAEAVSDFLLQYYEARFIPQEIILPYDFADREILERALTEWSENRKVSLTVPSKGQKMRLVELSHKNALYHLEESLNKRAKEKIRLQALQDKFQLDEFPLRIDCIDISNIQGTAIVASQVCFLGGRPAKDKYRLFNIEDSRTSPDDYWAIGEVTKRYFARLLHEKECPQLLVIDGGKGQMAAALATLNHFPDLKIPIVGLAKNRIRYSDDEEVRTEERVFFPGQRDPYILKEGSPVYQILTQIRDEAHRFAITHHRKRRKGVLQKSVLDEIPGIGPSLRKKLLAYAGDIEQLRNMSWEDLSKIPGLRKSVAEALFKKLSSY
ncbi:MAG: excinuclease ABC subunit UvrC [Deltaproteobacteria bacterium]|nr:excinuclease ABC subunit UvrC [Deltaproteobacteria bacterium]